MAFALLTHTSAQSNSASATVTSAIDTTGADLLVAVGIGFTGTIVSDNKSNTWHELTLQGSGSQGAAAIWYAWNPTVGTGHTFTQGAQFGGIAVVAFSGSQTSSDPFDVENGAVAPSSTSPLQTGSVTPSVDNELLVFGATGNWGGVLSVDIGTIIENLPVATSFATSLAYQIQTTKTARNPSFSWTGGTANGVEALIATFKAASGAAAYVPYNPWPQQAPVLAQ